MSSLGETLLATPNQNLVVNTHLRAFERTLALCLIILTCFFIPISTTFKSIGIVCLMIWIGFTPSYRLVALQWFKTGLGISLSCFFLYLCFSCLWSDASWHDRLSGVEKNTKLLYLPFLAAIFSNRLFRLAGFYSLLAGIGVVAMLSILSFFHCWPFYHLNPDDVFKNHIIMGYMGACGLYISAYLALKSKGIGHFPRHPERSEGSHATGRRSLAALGMTWGVTGMAHYLYFGLSVLLAFQLLWVNAGRMGYVLCIGLIGLLCWQFRKSRSHWKLLASLSALVTLVLLLSPVGQARIAQMMHEWREVRGGHTETSVGYRIQFHTLAKQLFLTHPILGNGAGSYGAYVETHPVFPNWKEGKLREPHSQYWLFAAEQGALGVLLWGILLGMIGITVCSASTSRARDLLTGRLAFAMLLAFCLNQFTDSMLYYSPGFFFVMLMAMSLGEAYENSV